MRGNLFGISENCSTKSYSSQVWSGQSDYHKTLNNSRGEMHSTIWVEWADDHFGLG